MAPGRRQGGTEALKSKGPVSRERLSPRQWARLEAEPAKGPLLHGFVDDQRWTLKRIKTVIGRLFHIGYTIEGVWKLMRRHGWSVQVPVRQALERDEEATAVRKNKVWPEVKAWQRTCAAGAAMADFAAAGLPGLVRIVKRKLKKIQYRPHPDRRVPDQDRPGH